MSNLNLDSIDRKLISRLQADFPLITEPFTDLGLSLGIAGEEVIQRVERLKAAGIIRQISPILDAQRLGYKTTLVAMMVTDGQLERAEQVISEHPQISHGYMREHPFNLWVTLAVSGEDDVEVELERLASATGAETTFALPAVKVFKLRAYFGVDGELQPEAASPAEAKSLSQPAELSQIDRLIINEIQQDLPLTSHPFSGMSARLGMDEGHFLAQSQSLLSRGIMRRFGASVNHRKVGYKANAMACWAAPANKIKAVGKKLASLPEVSHCYERKTNSLWPYNLFAMIHGHREEVCQEVANRVSAEIGLTERVLLFSTRELRKTRVIYQV